jgi:hypothetical protein
MRFFPSTPADVLPGLGSVSRDAAEQRALAAYEQFNKRRRLAAEQQGADDAMVALEDAARMAEQHRPGEPTMSFSRYPAAKWVDAGQMPTSSAVWKA